MSLRVPARLRAFADQLIQLAEDTSQPHFLLTFQESQSEERYLVEVLVKRGYLVLVK